MNGTMKIGFVSLDPERRWTEKQDVLTADWFKSHTWIYISCKGIGWVRQNKLVELVRDLHCL